MKYSNQDLPNDFDEDHDHKNLLKMKHFNFLPSFELKPVNYHEPMFNHLKEGNIMTQPDEHGEVTIDYIKVQKFIEFNLKIYV